MHGESIRFAPCGSGSTYRLGGICGLRLLVLYSAPTDFSLSTLVFSFPQKKSKKIIDLIRVNFISVTNQCSRAKSTKT